MEGATEEARVTVKLTGAADNGFSPLVTMLIPLPEPRRKHASSSREVLCLRMNTLSLVLLHGCLLSNAVVHGNP